MNFWTDERVEMLRGRMAAGRSAGEVRDEMNDQYGTYITRNVVLGKAFRLKLKWENSSGFSSKPPRMKPSPVSRKALASLPTDLPPKPCSLLDLANETCRWPHGDPDTPEFYFCGSPSADLLRGRAYCADHCRIAYRQPGQVEAAA